MASSMEYVENGYPQEMATDHEGLGDLPRMAIWSSRRLQWFAAPEGSYPEQFQLDCGNGPVCYRRLSPEYITWLRAHCQDGLDGRSQQVVQARQQDFGSGIELYMPQFVGCDADISNYKGPSVDSVSWARG